MIGREVATLAWLAALAMLSQLPWGRTPDQAVIRLSWRTTGQQVKVAMAQDPSLPPHMRLPEGQAFEVKIRPYLLSVSLDGKPALARAVLAPGLRHDRPLTVFEEFYLSPGAHRLEVHFQAQEMAGAAAPETSAPFQSDLVCQAGRVYLLTMDESGGWVLDYFKPP